VARKENTGNIFLHSTTSKNKKQYLPQFWFLNYNKTLLIQIKSNIMSFIRKNIWSVGFAFILVGAFVAMGFASKNSSLPSPNSVAKDTIDFTILPDDHKKGSENPKVVLMEFSDFQCPACAAYYPVIKELINEFPNDLQFVYRHFPLKAIHFQAENAAIAAEAAGLQGKFWEMHDALFDNQTKWNPKTGKGAFREYAELIGLDMNKYDEDINSDILRDKVRRDNDFAVSNGLNSTPTFYLNGNKITNPGSYEDFKNLIVQGIDKSIATE
jgi:protein-disulfide isomerase